MSRNAEIKEIGEICGKLDLILKTVEDSSKKIEIMSDRIITNEMEICTINKRCTQRVSIAKWVLTFLLSATGAVVALLSLVGGQNGFLK